VLKPSAAGDFPQGLKPKFSTLITARLKPCPFKT